MTMKKLQVFGTGCSKCVKLTENTKAAAEHLKLEFELEKVTDILSFADHGVMVTPALAVDGRVVVSGRVPSVDELARMLG
jgi:small redox-active disulfide protein 2